MDIVALQFDHDPRYLGRVEQDEIVNQLLDEIATPRPAASREAAEEAICRLYTCMGYPRQPKIIWCPSPVSMIAAHRWIDVWKTDMDGGLPPRPVAPEAIRGFIRASMAVEMPGAFWPEVESIFEESRMHSGPKMNLRILHHIRERVRSRVGPGFVDAVERRVFQFAVRRDDRQVGRSRERINENSILWHMFGVTGDNRYRDLLGNAFNLEFQRHTLSCLRQIARAGGYLSDADPVALLHDVSKQVGWISHYEGICWVTPPSTIALFDSRGQLHCTNGPALSYEGAWRGYSIDGTPAPHYAVEDPHRITIGLIDSTLSIALRRLLISRYQGNYLQDCGARLVSHDKLGGLYVKRRRGDSDIVFVRVTNSTAEPDGSYREYFLRVPWWIKSPTEGIAWSFDMTPEEYLKTQKMT